MKKSRIILFLIILSACIIMIKGCRDAGEWLIRKDKIPAHADAIVMLMGSIADRVLETADCYHKGYADQVILVRESMGAYAELEKRGVHLISSTDQVRNALSKLGIPGNQIHILPGDATSTQMEAILIEKYMSEIPSLDTLIIVSSSEHMRRASMIFRKVCGKDIQVICCPSTYTDFKGIKWWQNKEGIQTVIFEYLKILNFIFFEKNKLNLSDINQT